VRRCPWHPSNKRVRVSHSPKLIVDMECARWFHLVMVNLMLVLFQVDAKVCGISSLRETCDLYAEEDLCMCRQSSSFIHLAFT
jgi:hypothetical protein